MRQSSNPFGGSQAFTIKVAKGEDGSYEASCPQQPSIEAVTATSSASAVNSLRKKLEEAASKGTLVSR